ncbi:MAG TPA: exosortase [Candidatus Sulfotelmatobacter sp.]|nr:exosortase [Candidatus Sulfotelmatobacter sp.]
MPVKELKLAPGKSPLIFEAPISTRKNNKRRIFACLVATALLGLCFSVPIYHLLRLAFTDDLYSDVPLIPFVSAYLVWLRRHRMPVSFEPAPVPAALFSLAGLVVVAAGWFSFHEAAPPGEDSLALNILALLLLFVGICFVFLGKAFIRAFALPVAMLGFAVPFPTAVRQGIETLLQHGSAAFAALFFGLAGDPVIRDGLVFHLPDISIRVAPECSGIHSTLVLTIVSVAGSWLFLRTPWKRAVLVLAVIPLALMRNGFRIFVLGRLCIAFGPQMLDSQIHHHGGPIFFALSLLPFFLLLLFLRKTERPRPNREPLTKPSL